MFKRQNLLPLKRTRRQKSSRPASIRTWRLVTAVTLVAFASVYVAFAAISLSTSIPYTQNFASLGIPLSTPSPSTLPADFFLDTINAPRTFGALVGSPYNHCARRWRKRLYERRQRQL